MARLTPEEIVNKLLPARKRGEARDWAIIGENPDIESNPFVSSTGETNTIYATINGNSDPQIIYYDPALDPRILQYGTRVLLEYINGKAWIYGIDKEYVTQAQGGLPLPTGNFPLREHDHTDDDNGGALGADTVDTTQLVNGAVVEAKIGTGAVTNTKIGASAVDTTQIADDAVTPTKTDGLTGASAAIVAQTASDAFTSIPYTLTSNTRLYWNGTTIRAAYTYFSNAGGTLTTSSTTQLTLKTSPDMAGLVDTTNSYIKTMVNLDASFTTANDTFLFEWQYNFDSAGAEAWQRFCEIPANSQQAGGYIIVAPTNTTALPLTFMGLFLSSAQINTWGYSGTYKLRFVVQRIGGTGTFSVNATSGGAAQFFSIEEL